MEQRDENHRRNKSEMSSAFHPALSCFDASRFGWLDLPRGVESLLRGGTGERKMRPWHINSLRRT
jgi:hypothetical protein